MLDSGGARRVVSASSAGRVLLPLVLATPSSKARTLCQLSNLKMLMGQLRYTETTLQTQAWLTGREGHSWGSAAVNFRLLSSLLLYNISLIFISHHSTVLLQGWICYMWLMELQHRNPTRRDLLLGTLRMLTNTWNIIISESDNSMKFKWRDALWGWLDLWPRRYLRQLLDILLSSFSLIDTLSEAK